MINLYQSDVRAMSDEMLKVLSEELQEAYGRNGSGDDYWLDDDAEVRYYEMAAEIRRRWDEAHPEQAGQRNGTLAGYLANSALISLRDQLQLTRSISGSKIGDRVTVAKPYRFQA